SQTPYRGRPKRCPAGGRPAVTEPTAQTRSTGGRSSDSGSCPRLKRSRSTISEALEGEARKVQLSPRGQPDEDALRPTVGSRRQSSLRRGGPTIDAQHLDTYARLRPAPRRGPSCACRRLTRTPSPTRELATRAPAPQAGC